MLIVLNIIRTLIKWLTNGIRKENRSEHTESIEETDFQ